MIAKAVCNGAENFGLEILMLVSDPGLETCGLLEVYTTEKRTPYLSPLKECHFVEVLDTGLVEEVSLIHWFALTLNYLVAQVLDAPTHVVEHMSRQKDSVTTGDPKVV